MFYLRLFRALDDAGVRYLVVGGIAVNLHGINRLTADIDLMVAMDADNLARFVSVARNCEMRPVIPAALEDLADASKVRDWIENKHMLAFGLRPKTRTDPTVDILVQPPLNFEDAYARRVLSDVAGIMVSTAAIEDIIRMKSGTGRQKDQADILALRRLLEVRKENGKR